LHAVPGAGNFDLTALGKDSKSVAVRAFVNVYSPIVQNVQLWVGSYNGVRVVVNGVVVHTKAIQRDFAADEDRIKPVLLKKGWNAVLLTLTRTSGPAGFSLKIKDDRGESPPPGLSTSVERF